MLYYNELIIFFHLAARNVPKHLCKKESPIAKETCPNEKLVDVPQEKKGERSKQGGRTVTALGRNSYHYNRDNSCN